MLILSEIIYLKNFNLRPLLMDNGRSQQFRKKIWHIWVKLNISIDIQFMLFKFNLTVRKEQSERVFVSILFSTYLCLASQLCEVDKQCRPR